ncbi:hypothetical protein N752_07385 [Desulforamulus aquiferis]|nr:hypothetical protein N752_07385 [Desulforamulus aquiferis]
MLKQGVPPYNILAITFTNKAAAEMKNRVERLVPDQARDLWVSTFHSTCLRILRREIQTLGYGSNFSIYDDADQQTLVKECLRELEIDEKRFQPRGMLSSISGAKINYLDQRIMSGRPMTTLNRWQPRFIVCIRQSSLRIMP